MGGCKKKGNLWLSKNTCNSNEEPCDRAYYRCIYGIYGNKGRGCLILLEDGRNISRGVTFEVGPRGGKQDPLPDRKGIYKIMLCCKTLQVAHGE